MKRENSKQSESKTERKIGGKEETKKEDEVNERHQ